MGITDFFLRNYFKIRQRSIERWIRNPHPYQKAILKRIIYKNRNTKFGKEHKFNSIHSPEDYIDQVPARTYEELLPYIKAMLEGQNNILCSSKISWFAKSSGTSNGRSKYIPLSSAYLKHGHLKCAWDVASFIYNEDPKAHLFKDKSLIMGGCIESLNNGLKAGDISAIILHHFPKIGRRFYTPDLDTALMKDWDAKIKKIASITIDQNITLLAGVPTWTLVLLEEVLAQTGKNNISEVWPNLRSFLHGGVGFEPYRKTFQEYIPSDKINYREAYNASEGYFAMQNEKDLEGMLLLCDHEIYYEFAIVSKTHGGFSKVLSLDEVELNQDYALIISNTSGLYRYIIGDIISFVSINPFKIKLTGRIQQQLNVFGEELSIHNTETALSKVCNKFNCSISNFTVGPIFMSQDKNGAHEWLIEFKDQEPNPSTFAEALDIELRQLNSDYDAKRSYDMVLENLKLTIVPKGTFEKWLRQNSKFGGQNKIPRLQNDRKFIDEIKLVLRKQIKSSSL